MQIVLKLCDSSVYGELLVFSRLSNGQDVTVLMLALIQLSGPWTPTRIGVMGHALVKETEVVRKHPQGSYLEHIMDMFIRTNSDAAVRTVLFAYRISESSNCYEFFKILYASCCKIPDFIRLLSAVRCIPDQPNLQMLVHLVFLNSKGKWNQLELALNQYMDAAKLYLINLLINLLISYRFYKLVVIDNIYDALWTMNYLTKIMRSYNIPAESQKRFLELYDYMHSQAGELAINIACSVQAYLYDRSAVLSNVLQKLFLLLTTSNGGSCFRLEVSKELKVVQPSDPIWKKILELISIVINRQFLTLENVCHFIVDVSSYAQEFPEPAVLNQYLIKWSQVLYGQVQFINRLLVIPSIQAIPALYGELQMLLNKSVQDAKASENPDMSSVSPSLLHDIPQDRIVQLSPEQLEDLKNRQLEIQKAIVPISSEEVSPVPEERVVNRISMLINNLTEVNLDTKFDDFRTLLGTGYDKWFADFLVRSRVERQTNYHRVYLRLVDRLVQVNGPLLFDEVIKTSIQVSRELLTSDTKTLKERHSFFRNMGEWLGLLTIGQDVCLSQLHLNLTQELLIAFYHKRLWYVYEFVCYLLRGCKESKVIKPPQPWLMALLSLLKEISEVPGINDHFSRLFDNFLAYVNYKIESIPFVKSELYLAIPEVANNTDFTDKASQEEVIKYFLVNYPQLRELQSKGQGLRALIHNKAIPEFIPRFSHPMAASNGEVMGGKEGASDHSSMLDSFIAIIKNEVEYNDAIRVVSKSVVSMYVRDLAPVSNTHDVMDCLKNAARSLLDNLLIAMVPAWENILSQTYCFCQENVMSTIPMIEKTITSESEFCFEQIREAMMATIMMEVENQILDDRSGGSSAVAVLVKKQPLFQEFSNLTDAEDMTENEKIVEGQMTEQQRDVYLQMPIIPELKTGLLSKEDLHGYVVELHYKRIIQELAEIYRSTQTKRVPGVNYDQIKVAFEWIYRCINRIEEYHVPPHDKYLTNYIINIIAKQEVYANPGVLDLFLRIASFMSLHGFTALVQLLTSLFLERVLQVEQKQLCISVVVTLAFFRLLDLSMLDAMLQKNLASVVPFSANVSFFFLIVTDLVLIRELVTVDQLPLSMKALESLATTENGKRVWRIEGNSFSFASFYEALQNKQKVITARVQLNQVLDSDECENLRDSFKRILSRIGTESYILYVPGNVNKLVELIDSVISASGEGGVYTTLFCLLEESMNLCINHYDRNVQTLNDLCDVVIVTFGFLVQRESTENRPLVFKAELDVVQALLLQMHDTDIGRFNPNFFLRILVGLFKEIVVGEKDKKVREELAVQFATLMRTVGPSSCPAFLVAWMQLYTMPQVLRLLIGEKIPQLVSLAGDMIVSLFSLTVTHFVTVLDNYCNACINLLQLLCISFPGFLARRCSELIRYLSGRIREIVLSDCPPEFDIAYSKEDPETFLSRVIEIRVEPNMIYKQELMRGNLLDATENVMRCKDLNTNGIYILRSLEVNQSYVSILRAIVMFWVMEEERIKKSTPENTRIFKPIECINYILHGVNQNAEYKEVIVDTVLEYVRFPCKETALFIQVTLDMYYYMDMNTRQMIVHKLHKKAPLKQYGVEYLLKGLHLN